MDHEDRTERDEMTDELEAAAREGFNANPIAQMYAERQAERDTARLEDRMAALRELEVQAEAAPPITGRVFKLEGEEWSDVEWDQLAGALSLLFSLEVTDLGNAPADHFVTLTFTPEGS